MEEVRFHDPVLALDGKENGLYFYEKITEQAGTYLKPGGWLMYEIGCDQGMDVSEIMKKNGFEQIEIKKDLAEKKPDCYNEVNVDKKNLCEDKTKIQIGRAQDL